MRNGERLPFCVGAGIGRRFYAPDVQAGRAAVLVLGGTLRAPALFGLVAALAGRAGELETLATDLLVLGGFSAGPAAWQSGPGNACGVPVLLCNDSFFAECGLAPGEAAVVVIDRAWRICASWCVGKLDLAALADAVLHAAGAIAREPARDCALPAPLLAVPGVFDASFCRDLIAHFEMTDNFDSGVSGAAADGPACDRVDHSKKHRRDCMLFAEDGYYEAVVEALLRRCAPEIKRAFQRDIAFTDRILVARYDDTGGYFKRHRDNMNEAVAFRQFAVSVNLNTGDYRGGELMFPEYNDHRYAPGVGGAIVFSTSLLHAALPVTSGRRYVLLTFLQDAEGEQRRQAFAQKQVRRTLPGSAIHS